MWKFEMGRLVATRGFEASGVSKEEWNKALNRHMRGDYGDMPAEDIETNNQAIIDGDRIMSAYTSSAGTKFWIITEADRSYTTILLPEEY